MIRRYAFKKFFIITASIALIFGSSQITSVQKKIIQAFAGHSITFDFKNSKGIFPFDFEINDIKLSTNDFEININNLKILLSAKMFHVKHFRIDKAQVKILQETKLYPSDLKMALSLIVQKIIDFVEINELSIDKEILKNIKLSYDPQNNERRFEADSRFGKFLALWNFKDSKINGEISFNDTKIQAEYDKSNSYLMAKYGEITLDGILSDVLFNGEVAISNWRPNIEISTKDEFFKIAVNDKSTGLSAKIDYDIDKFVAYVHDVSIPNILTASQFTINKDLKVSDFSVLFKKGKAAFKGIDLSSNKFSLGTCSFSDIDLEQLKDLEVKGIVNGSGNFKDGKENLKLNFKNLQYGELKIPTLDLSSQHSKNETKISAALDMFKKNQKLDFKIQTNDWLISKDSQLDFKTDGNIDFNDLKVASGQRIRGKLDYNIQIAGTLQSPLLSGKISIKDGVYVNLQSGTYIRDITLDCLLDKNFLNIKKIYARDDSKKGGTIVGSGGIKYINDQLKTDIKLKIENFKAVDQKWLNGGRLFGNITFKGDLFSKVNVNGDLYSADPEIDVSGIVMLSMRSTDLIAKPKKKTKSQSFEKLKFPTDIKLEMKPKLKVQGFGLKSIWQGGAKVTGDLMDPNYVATAKLESGKIELTDNAFNLKDGDVLINKDDMNISVAAEKNIDKILVGARFHQGNGESKVSFYSNPYMSEKDIVSYMLFDKNASEISMGEGMSLFTTMNKLSGRADFDILGRMKTIFGVDTISIKKNKNSSGEEYDSVSLGKKLGKFKVSVDQATGKDGTDVVVEADIAKHTKASVDLSSRDSFGGGILWSRRY